MSRIVYKIISFTFLCALALGLCASSSVDQQSVKIKSAYLINFVRFISWPESNKERISIGFLGANKLEDYIIKTKSIAEKRARLKINLIHFNEPDSVLNCDILYTENAKYLKKSPALIQYCSDNNILLVTSRTLKFPANSCINFLIVNSKLRFEINHELLKNNNLKASAQLLKLSYKR